MDSLGLKQRLLNGECVYGPFVRIPDPVVTEIIGYAGWDFCIIDLEHGPMSVFQAQDLVRSAKAAGMSPLIRTREMAETMIVRALDTGAAGVQIPQVNSAAAAREAVRAAKFYPMGERGVCKFTRNAEYSRIPTEGYFEKANRESLVIMQIEGMGGVKEIDEILEVEGIDVVFLGPYDLSQSLGLTGQVTHPEVVRTLEKMVDKIRRKGIAAGCFANTHEALKAQRDMGVQYLSCYIDTGFIYESFKNDLMSIKA